ncbi:MAG: Gfalike protein [Caulobacter sp.]|nr:Gfalike protein [Caulobacter sp.]
MAAIPETTLTELTKPPGKGRKAPGPVARGGCVCGAVRLEMEIPAVWAWHDHGKASRHAQGCAYATYVGSWKSRVRVTRGEDAITRFEDRALGTIRSFCAACGTPLFYERPRAPKMVNIPRALFETRTGREPRYHLNIGETADWEYTGAALGALKGYPGVVWERPKARTRRPPDDLF